MVQVIKRTKVKGEVFESPMSFSDNEWKLIQKHYPSGGVSFKVIDEKEAVAEEIKVVKADNPGRVEDDDKPKMKDYNSLKDAGTKYFNEENWDRALYYYEAAYKLKSFGWLVGKMNKCKKNNLSEQNIIQRISSRDKVHKVCT